MTNLYNKEKTVKKTLVHIEALPKRKQYEEKKLSGNQTFSNQYKYINKKTMVSLVALVMKNILRKKKRENRESLTIQ